MADEWKPKIIGIICNWCSYAGADGAGSARTQYPPDVRIVRVMCTGRIDTLFVLKAFADGADGVLVSGCHFGDCHYLRRSKVGSGDQRCDQHRERDRTKPDCSRKKEKRIINMTTGNPSPLVSLFQKEDFDDWSKPHLVGDTTEYSALLELQKMQKGDQRKYGNGIIVSVVTCTEIKQGIAIETGKTSPQYFNACSIIELHEDDFKALGINKNTNVRVTSAAGSVILKAVVTTQSLYPGLAHIPMGPWANMVVPAYTYSTGEPCFCGFDCLIEPAPEEKIENAVKLLHEKCGLKYVGDPHYD